MLRNEQGHFGGLVHWKIIVHRARFKSAWKSAGRDGKEGDELFRSMARGSDLRHMTQKTWELRNKSIRCSESMDSLTVVLYAMGVL